MKAYKVFCFDLDGTVYRGSQPIPESIEFIRSLQKIGIEPYFITNNSSLTRAGQLAKLATFGISTTESHIMTSAIATATYCVQQFAGLSVQMIGEAGLREALQESGVRIVEKSGDVVVMGIDRNVTYNQLAEVCLSIRAGAHFLATNGDVAYPGEAGLLPGNGAFVELVKTSTGKEPIILGKPESYMLEYIRQQSGASKSDMIMIGDNYDTDIEAGLRYGIDTVFIEGGVSTLDEVMQKPLLPTFSIRTLSEWGLIMS